MDSTVLAAVITALATVAAAMLAVYSSRRRRAATNRGAASTARVDPIIARKLLIPVVIAGSVLVTVVALYHISSERATVVLMFLDEKSEPVQNLNVTVRQKPREEIRKPRTEEVSGVETLVTQSITNESGTLTFEVRREQQSLRIYVTGTYGQFTEDLNINDSIVQKERIEFSVLIPEHVISRE